MSDPTPGAAGGLPRSAVLLLSIGGAVLGAAALRIASGTVAPMMLALVLTIAVLPISNGIRRRGAPTWVATMAALGAAYAILLVLVLGSALCLLKLAQELPTYSSKATSLLDKIDAQLKSLGISNGTGTLHKLDPSKVVTVIEKILGGVVTTAGHFTLLAALMFFFVAAVPAFGPRMAAMARLKPELSASLSHFVVSTQHYLVVTAVFGAIVAAFDTVALYFLAVPLPLVWGFFSFLTNFIPNIGFVLGVVPPALLALLANGPRSAVLVLVIYSILNVVIQTFIQPRFVGNSVGLSTELTFVSLIVWAFLLGGLGALLAVPMTLLVRAIFIDADRRAAWVTPLIDSSVEPEDAPPPAPAPA